MCLRGSEAHPGGRGLPLPTRYRRSHHLYGHRPFTDRLRYEEAAGWGLLGWARPVIDVVFDGVSDTFDFQMKELLPGTKDGTRRYYLFQRELVAVSDAMDDASPENLKDLKLLAAPP